MNMTSILDFSIVTNIVGFTKMDCFSMSWSKLSADSLGMILTHSPVSLLVCNGFNEHVPQLLFCHDPACCLYNIFLPYFLLVV